MCFGIFTGLQESSLSIFVKKIRKRHDHQQSLFLPSLSLTPQSTLSYQYSTSCICRFAGFEHFLQVDSQYVAFVCVCFHLFKCFQGSSILYHPLVFFSFLLPSNILLYTFTTFMYLCSVHQLMAFVLFPLWAIMNNAATTFIQNFCVEINFS